MKKGKGNPLARCPYCGKQLDGWTPVDVPEATPKDGDFSLCVGCKHLVIFNADQTVREPTSKERKEFKQWLREWRRTERRKKMH